MTSSPSRKRSSRDKVRTYRARMRARGLRPVQIWVPDTRTDDFARQAHRQAAAVAASVHAVDDQAFIDTLSGEI